MTSDAIMTERAEIEAEVAGKTTGDFLLRNAQEQADRPALSWKQGRRWKSLTWSEFRKRVAEVAEGLASLGVGRGDYMAIMAANRPEHIIADQGVVHAGGAPTTFYATLAPEQIQYVANNCSAKVAILENRAFMESWLPVRDEMPMLEHIVLIEDHEAYADRDDVISWDSLVERGREALAKDREAFEKRWRKVKPDDPATLIYTSGTTGPPKGVILTHRNCVWEATAIDLLTNLPDGVTGVSYLPLAHIAERMLSVYMPLRKAMRVYFCPDVKQASEYVREARPSVFFGVPRVWEKMRAGITAKIESEENPRKRQLLRAAVDTGLEVVRRQQAGQRVSVRLRLKHGFLDWLILSKIRAAIGLGRCDFASSAAAPLPVDVAEFFAAIGLPIIEVYGMTETTGVCTGNRPGAIKIGTVGPALPGVEVRLDDDGEILSRGPNNTPGYLNRPEATAELIDRDGWIHTGDIGEIDNDGYFKVVDRKKELIITAGGKNISPANIESLLKEHPLVGQALAYGDRKPFVAALIVLDGEVAPGWAEQRGIEFTDIAALAEHPAVLEEVQKAVDAANERLARVEQVKRFRILPTEWTAESEELTPTMKLKRRVIHRTYRAEIEALYASE